MDSLCTGEINQLNLVKHIFFHAKDIAVRAFVIVCLTGLVQTPWRLPAKEALHFHMTPAEEHLNRDIGLEIPRCWLAALKKQETRTNCTNP